MYTRSTNTSDILTTYETDTMFAFIHSVTHDEKCDGQGLPYIPNTSDIEEFKTEYRGYKYKNVGVNKDRYGLVISSTTRTCVEALDGKRWNVSISYSEYGLTNGYLSGKAYLPTSFIANDGESLLDNIYAEETYFDYRMVPGKDQEMSFNLQLNLKYKTNAENNPYYGNMLSYLGDDGGYTFATMYVIIEYTTIKEGYTTTYTGHIEREDADAVLGTVLENYLPCLGIYNFDYNLNKINNTPFTDVPTTI